jgi:ADP-ribose pyrophosphatase
MLTTMSDHLNEKSIQNELLYDGRVVHLYRETVELPDGTTATREVVRHIGAVAILPFDADGKLIMVRQFRLPARQALLEIPAGTLEPDEAPEACAIRECQEEIGYKPGHIQRIGSVFLAPGYSTEHLHFFVARDLIESRLAHDADEFLEVERYSLDEVQGMIASGAICDAKTLSGLMIYRALGF